MRELLYGAAYYDEYMPYERLEKDVAMMKKAIRFGLQSLHGAPVNRRKVFLTFHM
mgnify:CR=1 FL=1